MANNLELDDDLIADAVRLAGHKTKREAVTATLQEYIKSKQRTGIWNCSARSILTRLTITRPCAGGTLGAL